MTTASRDLPNPPRPRVRPMMIALAGCQSLAPSLGRHAVNRIITGVLFVDTIPALVIYRLWARDPLLRFCFSRPTPSTRAFPVQTPPTP